MSTVDVRLPSLHPGQQKIADHPARFKVVRCGRRFGKTKMGIRIGCESAVNGGQVGLFFPAHKYALEAWREVVRRLRPLIEMPGGRVSEQEKRIELPNGGVIEVWSLDSNEDPARGRSYSWVIVDEAGLIGNLIHIWDTALRPTLVDQGGRALFLGTPKGARTPFNVMWDRAELGENPDWAAFQGRTIDNILIPGLVKEVEDARREAELRGTLALWAQEFEGQIADDGSNPIGLNAIRACVAEASKHPTVAWGVDLAKSVDFTVAVGFDSYGRWTQFHRFQHDWGTTKKRLLELIGYDVPVIMDATGTGSPIVEDMYRAGMNVNGFVFSRKSKNLLIEDLIAAFHAKRLTIPSGQCQNEFESLGVSYNSETNYTRYEVPQGGHDDCIMAVALAWRCFSYEAPLPDWPTRREDNPWSADVDGARLVHAEEDDVDFVGLGEGW